MPKYLLGLLMLGLWSCHQAETAAPAPSVPYFFDLAGFFKTEIKHLKQAKVKADKMVRYNEQTDTLPAQALDFEKELAVFVHSDINKLAWREKYQADTLRNAAGQLNQIRYRAQDEQLKTQQITIRFANNQVQRIDIRNHLESILANNWQDLQYLPGLGYRVSGHQTMRLTGKDQMSIEVNFKP